jgi:signal transduction histidine kinase/ligand-binding sensor domain-containing protein
MRVAVILLFVLVEATYAQDYRFRLYRVEQGLPSDVIKAVSQDSKGFIWIATDDGLVKYDGLKFTTYKSALRSQYVKSFLQTRDGRLLVIGDLDLVEIENKVDTVVFKTLLLGARTAADSTIWYPKSLFEDLHGGVWLAESKSVVRLDEGGMKRYDFGNQNHSSVFTRSFSFFEDSQRNLFIVSYAGKIFWFNRQRDEFVPLPDVLPGECSYILFRNNKLWIAAGSGLYSAEIENLKFKNVTRVLPIVQASHLLPVSDSLMWVSTYEEDCYIVNPDRKEVSWELLPYKFNGTNSSYRSFEGDVWSCTDKGLVLTQKNLFVLADGYSQSHFIEGITSDAATNTIYYCNKDELIELKYNSVQDVERQVVHAGSENYFQAIQFGGGKLWASSGTNLYLFEKNKLLWRHNFSNEGNFIHDIFLDSKNTLWLSQAGNSNIMSMDDTSFVKHYALPPTRRPEINVIREGPEGIYAASSGTVSYLFFKAHREQVFKNISAQVNFKIQGDLNIYDLAIEKDVVWIASTEGLLRYQRGEINRVDLGDAYTTSAVSSVEILDRSNILFSNSHGLFRYNIASQEFWLYDENSGLPSNTITGRGIFIDHQKRLWIGTSFGIAVAQQSITLSSPTVKPFCVDARVNGSPVLFNQGIKAPYGSFVNLLFSAITFPENKINLQWKLEGRDTSWRTVSNHQVDLVDLSAGVHVVNVRAKKNTGLGWSEPATMTIVVGKPFWQRAEFIFFIITIVLIIAWLSNNITSRVLNRRKEILHELIDERTKDLQRANDGLTLRNNELDRFVYSASHDLSAPLKSVLGLISVSRLENPDGQHVQYLNMMEASVRKLEDFIKDVVSYSRNTRLEVKMETFHFSELVKDLLDDHQYAPNFSRINFEIADQAGLAMTSDIMRLKIILNNLISNAIKFHRFDGSVVPYIRISLAHQERAYVITVEDNGQGIEEQHLSRIFEMFYRASEEAQGSGLGLYILKEAVSKMNGRVTVRSTPYVGTTFTVMLHK